MHRPLLALFLTLALAAEDIPLSVILDIDLADARDDQGWVAPVSRSVDHLAADPAKQARFAALMARIDAWAPAGETSAHLYRRLNAAALADLGRSDLEAEVNLAVFASLIALPHRDAVLQATAAVALGRTSGVPLLSVPDLGLKANVTAEQTEERIRLLARKLLGRLLGRLPVQTR
jgi:hypothetical protein